MTKLDTFANRFGLLLFGTRRRTIASSVIAIVLNAGCAVAFPNPLTFVNWIAVGFVAAGLVLGELRRRRPELTDEDIARLQAAFRAEVVRFMAQAEAGGWPSNDNEHRPSIH